MATIRNDGPNVTSTYRGDSFVNVHPMVLRKLHPTRYVLQLFEFRIDQDALDSAAGVNFHGQGASRRFGLLLNAMSKVRYSRKSVLMDSRVSTDAPRYNYSIF
ncbi:hypothetical protein Tco_0766279 [Tanacetum coccineum]